MKLARTTQGAARVLETYYERISAFYPNARLYLINASIAGVAMGIFRLLFNFFVLSRGYDEALLGNLVTASSLTALLAALPMGYLADFLGRKTSLVVGGCVVTGAVLVMVLFPTIPVLISMNILMGLAQALSGVTMGPFLMENSSEKERTYLFSFSSGIQMGSVFVGNWLGGVLPTWLASFRHVDPTSTAGYASALWATILLYGVGLLPLLLIRTQRLAKEKRSAFAPFAYAREHPGSIGRLIVPMLVTSVGAGLIIPFMNVFFREVHHQSDPVIGTVFAWGSLAMGIGLLLAPPLADRMGKIKFVVITQGVSIPFLFMLGFSPVFAISAFSYYVRNALMNMSGPVYQTFVMEHVEPSARATIASLVSMAQNFGWAISPTISGWLQVNYGFKPAFAGTIALYAISVYLYWSFFWPRKSKAQGFAMVETPESIQIE